MIGRSAILVCIVACVFIAIECKPLHREHKSLRRNVGQSVLQLKMTEGDINRGISIRINRGDKELVHRIPVTVEQRRNQRRKFRKSQSNIKKRLAAIASAANRMSENEVALNSAMKTNAKSVVMRSKRSVDNKKYTKIDDLHKFNEEISAENKDYSSEKHETTTHRATSRHGSSKLMQEEEQKKQLKFINSEDHRDYAFDTTDNEHINEDDDLLQRYYGTKQVRRAASSNNDDYGSFTDLMRVSANENERNDKFIRRLHYGNYEGAMNDRGEDDNNVDDEEVYDEYDNYADDDY